MPKPPASRRGPAPLETNADALREVSEPSGLFGFGEPDAARWGEMFRRIALGLTAALLVARFYWPGEDAEDGTGLVWVLAILGVLGVAVVGWWLGGTTRVRFSWADTAILVLLALVGLSTTLAADHRAAISMGWEWAALGVTYFLLRWLPRTRNETAALVGILVTTACTLSAVGFFQIGYEDPRDRDLYRQKPEQALRAAGVGADPATRKHFEDRLLGSKEPRATFALTNSLAGFLVGPAVLALAVAFENLGQRDGRGRRWFALFLASVPIAVLLGCLLLTKSRSAHVGLLVGLAIVAWYARRSVPRRVLIGAGIGLGVLLAAFVIVGVATRQLDPEVITESPKSLRYRLEYWRGTWDLITSSSRHFWRGVGPGNFAGPYLRFKLPTSSEEIKDPHDLILDVWATSGAWAAGMLILAIVLVSRETLGRPRVVAAERVPAEPLHSYPGFEESLPPARSGWLWFFGGIGGWLGVFLLGKINPFTDEGLLRWLVIGLSWGWSAVLLVPLWRRRAIWGVAVGAGFIAVFVNLLAAGGIAMPPVALGFWSLAALGQNLREDRPAGRIRALPGRGLSFSVGMITAALIGSFWGSNLPLWRCEARMAEAETALQKKTGPDYAKARDRYREAIAADKYSVKPWLASAEIEFRDWVANGPKPSRNVGIQIGTLLDYAAQPPRNRDALLVQRQRAFYADQLLQMQGELLAPSDRQWLMKERANAAARAVDLYPNDAMLHAALAEAVAALGRRDDALRQAREALRLDAVTPHEDKKLPADVRAQLRAVVEADAKAQDK